MNGEILNWNRDGYSHFVLKACSLYRAGNCVRTEFPMQHIINCFMQIVYSYTRNKHLQNSPKYIWIFNPQVIYKCLFWMCTSIEWIIIKHSFIAQTEYSRS
jgi:hypothetical protein